MSKEDKSNKGKGAPPTDWPVPTTGGVHRVVDGELMTEAEFIKRENDKTVAPTKAAGKSK